MSKKVAFTTKPTAQKADAWVSGQNDVKAKDPGEKLKRFTFDVPEGLHRRVKVRCAEKGVDMADEMRRILLENFPES